MSRVIQITVSIKGSLFALTDEGDIYVRTRRSPWKKVDSPVPPRFSLPEEYTPAPCQGSATELSSPGSFFMGDKQSEDRLNREHVIPEIERMHSLIPGPMPECPSMETTWINPNVRRRPTSIGSDGNYIPKAHLPAYAVKAIGWCIRKASPVQGVTPDYVGYLGLVYSDGSAGVSDRHYSSSEQFSWHDILLRLKNRDTSLSLDWLGCVQESDERLKPFANPEF